MLLTITKPLEIRIDINIETSEVYHYTWIFTVIMLFTIAFSSPHDNSTFILDDSLKSSERDFSYIDF